MTKTSVGSGTRARMEAWRVGAVAAIAFGLLELMSTIYGIAVGALSPTPSIMVGISPR